ncbi:MAG: acyl-CoA reductase [Bacteroidia bacterium]
MSSINSGDPLLEKTNIHNNWFTPKWQLYALNYWAVQLKSENLTSWISRYKFTNRPKKIGLIMAGNIPLVGIHDLICILVSGHTALVKTSSEDTVLTPWIIEQLIQIDERFKTKIEIIEKMNTCDALIATGSNNTARYFEYYFNKIPKIIRKNRNSLAILTGHETDEELKLLANDIFTYFGLGCRNVSKLLVPENYDFNRFFEALESFNELLNHNKYYNNYTYHKAIFLMNIAPHLDNGFLIVKEDEKLSSPLGCLFYSIYKERNDIIEYIDMHKEAIQIVIGDPKFIHECNPFGQSQNPALNDYADDLDTLHFLNQL